MYVRKTRDEYDVEVDYGYGWDVVCTEDTLKEARQTAKEYQENDRKPVRIRKHRVPMVPAKKESEKLSEHLAYLKEHKEELVEGSSSDDYYDAVKKTENLLRIEKNRELAEGDGATINYYTDRHACTVIRRTKKMIVLQRDKATLCKDYKPDFDVGGFAAHCTNNNEQLYEYEKDPDGAKYIGYWSEKKGCFVVDKCLTVSVGRHEFYDYNF